MLARNRHEPIECSASPVFRYYPSPSDARSPSDGERGWVRVSTQPPAARVCAEHEREAAGDFHAAGNLVPVRGNQQRDARRNEHRADDGNDGEKFVAAVLFQVEVGDDFIRCSPVMRPASWSFWMSPYFMIFPGLMVFVPNGQGINPPISRRFSKCREARPPPAIRHSTAGQRPPTPDRATLCP